MTRFDNLFEPWFTYPAAAAGPAYSGPGDVVAGATGWWSVARGYSAAYSTGSNKGANLRRASDNTTQDILILSNGNFDSASANTFAGTDATAQGSTTGLSTTMACTSASATPKVGDTVTGTGITQPCYVTAVGSFVAGAGNVTLNATQNIGVAETITFQVALFVTKLYDQSGHGNDMTQATNGSQPQWLPSGPNGKPFMLFNGGQDIDTGSVAWGAQPQSFAMVVERTGNFTSFQNYMWSADGIAIDGANSANTLYTSAGSAQTWTMSDSAWHAVQVVANGASSAVVVDSTQNAANIGGSSGSGQQHFGSGAQNLTGNVSEGGRWAGVAFSSGQQTSLHTNLSAFYGTP